MATRCYLACPSHEELVKGHCHIVPIQHHLTTLEGDDDLWDEIRVSMHFTNEPLGMLRALTTALEFHEMPNAHVCRRRQRSGVL